MPAIQNSGSIVPSNRNLESVLVGQFFNLINMFRYYDFQPELLQMVHPKDKIDEANGRYLVSAIYEDRGRYGLFTFPILFKELKKIQTQKLKSEYTYAKQQEVDMNEAAKRTTSQEERPNSILQTLIINSSQHIKRLFKPLGITLSLLSICNDLATQRIRKDYRFIHDLPIFGRIVILGFAFTYIIPAFRCYINELAIRSELKTLFDKAQEFIDQSFEYSAKDLVLGLSLQQRVLLHNSYPGTAADLQWEYAYLKVRLNEHGLMETDILFPYMTLSKYILSSTQDPDHIFQAQRTFVNRMESTCRSIIANLKSEPSHLIDHNLINECRAIYNRDIENAMQYNSAASEMRLKFSDELHAKLLDCIVKLSLSIASCRNSDWRIACKAFYAVYWEPYYEIVFPATTVIYYQMAGIFRLFAKPEESGEKSSVRNGIWNRRNFAHQHLLKAQELLEKIDPILAAVNKQYIDEYMAADLLLLDRNKPVPHIIPNANPKLIALERALDTYDRVVGNHNRRTLKRTASSPEIIYGSKQHVLDPRGPGNRGWNCQSKDIRYLIPPGSIDSMLESFKSKSVHLKFDRELTRTSSMPDVLQDKQGHFMDAPRLKF